MMRPILRSVSAQVARGRQTRGLFSSAIVDGSVGSIGIGGFIARAVAAAVGYGFFGPLVFGDTDKEFERKRQKDLEHLEKTEKTLDNYVKLFSRGP